MSRNLGDRLRRLEDHLAVERAGEGQDVRGVVIAVYLHDGDPDPPAGVPRHPDGRPWNLADLRRELADRDDLDAFSRSLLAERDDNDEGGGPL